MLATNDGYTLPDFLAIRLASAFCLELSFFGLPRPFGRSFSQTGFMLLVYQFVYYATVLSPYNNAKNMSMTQTAAKISTTFSYAVVFCVFW